MAEESTFNGQPWLPNDDSSNSIHPPLQHQKSPTNTDRLFAELRQILIEEPYNQGFPLRARRGRTSVRKAGHITTPDFAQSSVGSTMVGKKSGRALLREEGRPLYKYLDWEPTNYCFGRTGEDRQ